MDDPLIQPQTHPPNEHTASDDLDVCRVCRSEGDDDDPLIHPCKCAGSVRFVHPDCLRSWLSHSQKRYCEICGHKYTFTKVYPEHIPDFIPPIVYIRQIVRGLWYLLRIAMRFCLAVVVWLVLLPTANMISLRSLIWLADAIIRPSPKTPLASDEPVGDTQISSDSRWPTVFPIHNNTLTGFVFRGQILSLVVAGVLLCLILVREWINRHDWTEHMRPVVKEQEAIDPDEWVVIRGVATRYTEIAQSSDMAGTDLYRERVDNTSNHLRPSGPLQMDVAFTPPELLDQNAADEELGVNNDPDAVQDADSAAFMELLRSLDVDPSQPAGAPRPQPEIVGPIAVPNAARPVDADHWDDADEGNFEREDWDGILEGAVFTKALLMAVVGLIGPLSNLFQNAILATVIMGATLTVLVGTPIIAGKITLSMDLLSSTYRICRILYRLARKLTDPIVDICFEIVREVIALPILSSFQALERIAKHQLRLPQVTSTSSLARPFTTKDKIGSLVGVVSRIYQLQRDWAMERATSSALSDRLWCLATGYSVGAITVIIIAVAGEANVSRLSTGALENMQQYGKFLKLAFFMALEMALFPTIAGTTISICIVPLFPATSLSMRYAQLASSPFATIFVNWIMGTSFMYAFSALLSHIRTIVRPGTIFFIRDPTDASFSPVKDILERSTLSQLRKLCVSALMYCFVIFALFGAAPWALSAQTVMPLLPLRIKDERPWSSVPFDLLFVHLVIPPTVKYIRPVYKAKRLWNTFWRVASGWFCLTSLMYGNSRRAVAEQEKGAVWPSKIVWPIVDPLFQLAFGRYDNTSTDARVPATDRVALLSQAERKEHGVFIPLDKYGAPKSDKAKLALLKQDRRAREKNRVPKDDYQIVWLPRYWRTRVHAFIFAALTVAAWTIALSLFVPLVIGRTALGALTRQPCHDGYSYTIGVYICLSAAQIGRIAGRYISRSAYAKQLRRSDRSVRFKRFVLNAVSTLGKLLVLYGLFPLLVGMNLEIYVSIPVRYGVKAVAPVIHIWDAWSNGVVLTCLATAIHRRLFARPPRAMQGRSSWKTLMRAYQSPAKISARRLYVVAGPAILMLIIGLVLPMAMAFVSLWIVPAGTRAVIIYRMMYPASLGAVLYAIFGSHIRPQAQLVRQRLIDAEFVVEERVENYDPDETNPITVSEKPIPIGSESDQWVDEGDDESEL